MLPHHKNKLLQRTCVGCFKKFDQGDLVAVTRLKDGSVVVNLEQKLDGRSAYLCRKVECLKKARKGKRKNGLEFGLKVKVPPEIWSELATHMSAPA